MAVGRMHGIGTINGEAKSRTLTVEYEPSSVTVEGIQSALNQVGYESTLVENLGGRGLSDGSRDKM